MMIQTAPQGEPHFLCSMREHNALCGQFVRAFGNDEFERCEPHEEMVYVVSHHDYGWDEFDGDPVLDARTGLPCGVGNAPVPGGTDTGRRSADVNEARHLYCGLISSMHSWGLYNARYGFSEFRVRAGGSTSIPVGPGDREEVDRMLGGEIARQERIRETLAADPETAAWVEEAHIVQNYKQLQFFDTMALYFNCNGAADRKPETFTHVPRSRHEDATIALTPRDDVTYALDPYPFEEDGLEVSFAGRYVAPRRDAANVDLAAIDEESQTVRLVAG